MEKLIKEANYLYSIDENEVVKNVLTGKIMNSKQVQFKVNSVTLKCTTRKALMRIYFPEIVPPLKIRNIKEKVLIKRFNHIKKRCYNPKDKQYNNYGDRGIKVYDEWLFNPDLFVKYCIDNGFEIVLTIDRIDNNKGYFPGNLRFVSSYVQNNNMRSNIIIEYENKKYTLSQFCRKYNLNYKTTCEIYHKHKNNFDLFIFKIFNTHKGRKPIMFLGKYKYLIDISKEHNISYTSIRSRYYRGKRDYDLIKPV
jgi:hypothetical protein